VKKFALVGNPNCGKTTLFNSLTGSTAHVGNWPGVTVDKKDGVYKKCEENITIVDLPGIYSLSPYTPEEVVARNYIIDEKPDCVINIVDATNLERNLYLTTQIMEIDVPVIIALNMIDVIEKNGDKLDEKELEKRIGLPVVRISALKETGLDELMKKAYQTSKEERKGKTVLEETAIMHLIGDVKIALSGQKVKNPLFHSIKLVEGDELEISMHKDAVEMVSEFKKTFVDKLFGTDFEAMIADGRYRHISENLIGVIQHKVQTKFKNSKSDKADKVLTHKIWGIPIFLVILFGIFHLTFSEDFLYLGSIFHLPTLEDLGLMIDGEPISFWVKLLGTIYNGGIFSPGCFLNNIWNNIILGECFSWIKNIIFASGIAPWAVGLINNGIIEGISAVLSFLPWILTLFLLFSILEDSGYMARIAFILDKLFRKFGLSGRAFVPMIMGFGCSVPAMINTRTLADEKERTATIRVIPFFSCGAKLPILTAIAGGIVSFFGVGNADLITYGMYLIGIVTALVCVLLMKVTTLKGENPPFIMELPNYHFPQFNNLMVLLWDKAKHFIQKAFTVILASTIIIWVLTHFSFNWEFLSDANLNESILAGLSQLVQPLFTPLGFGSQLGRYGWIFVIATVTGIIAKENVVSTFSTLGACIVSASGIILEGLDLAAESGIDAVQAMILATNISIPGLLAFIIFNMTTIPCIASIITAKTELNDNKKFRNTILFWIFVSYIVSSMIYTIGLCWWISFVWFAILFLAFFILIIKNKKNDKALKMEK